MLDLNFCRNSVLNYHYFTKDIKVLQAMYWNEEFGNNVRNGFVSMPILARGWEGFFHWHEHRDYLSQFFN